MVNSKPITNTVNGPIPKDIVYESSKTHHIEFAKYFEDPDDDTLYYDLIQDDHDYLPRFFHFNNMEGSLNITSPPKEGGMFHLKMTATDPYLGEHSQSFNLIVNSKPVVNI